MHIYIHISILSSLLAACLLCLCTTLCKLMSVVNLVITMPVVRSSARRTHYIRCQISCRSGRVLQDAVQFLYVVSLYYYCMMHHACWIIHAIELPMNSGASKHIIRSFSAPLAGS
ncbi:hypothetical protein PVAP13_8NG298200 [Panicum virgatum]|uniref:Secreted protein n=1 Tax=Panicum virgatum TaxID=38727 RepID=A0A8T0PB33_PANVG|nr:hypothetical protein PVAP13_8NG298200 [Panicum virgatum]